MIGLEFNEKYIKVVELKDTAQGLTLSRYNISPVPPKAPNEDILDTIANAIRKVFSETGILETEVHTLIYGPMVQVRRLSLPPMPEAELHDAVKWEARNFTTFPIEGAVIDYHAMARPAAKESQKIDVMVAAVEKETFKRHLTTINLAGLRCVGITIAPFALGEVLRRNPLLPKNELVAVVDIGAEAASVSLFKDDVLQFTREISLGEQLQNEILSSFTYYREQFLEEKISRVYLSGEIPDINEFKDSLAAGLGITAEILDPLQNLRPDPRLDPAKLLEAASRLALVVGLAENKARDMNLLKIKEKAPPFDIRRFLETIPIPNSIVVGVLILILGFVFGMNFYLSRAIDKTKQELDVKTLKLEQLTKFQERKLAYDEIKTQKVEMRNILGQVAGLLPRGVILGSLSFDGEKRLLTLAGETSSPRSVSGFIKKLDGSAAFSQVKLKEIKKMGKITTFSLELHVE